MKIEDLHHQMLARELAKLMNWLRKRYQLDADMTYALTTTFLNAMTDLIDKDPSLSASLDEAHQTLVIEIQKVKNQLNRNQ